MDTTKQYLLRVEVVSDDYDTEKINDAIDAINDPTDKVPYIHGRVIYTYNDVLGNGFEDWMIVIESHDNITIEDVINVFVEKFNVERDCIHAYILKDYP